MSDVTKSDLRSSSQGFKRAATHKAKWAYGIHNDAPGRDANHPRPARLTDHLSPTAHRHRVRGSAFKVANADRNDMHAARVEYPSIVRKLPSLNSDESASSAEEDCDEHDINDGVIYGATTDYAPSSGSQVLNSALAKAIEAFEDKETDRLVKSEWSVLNDDGEEMGFSPVKKARGKKERPARIEDGYEIV
ncbi:hypothetical protein K461DRAFT_289606 [Myriangium duriaei CBS 260.36]|uniref:Uncharacterized protein n=1 Tax=Myriangium duriaei CBS 260.36 TaxID=1168546 RepID=A0A9P4MS81_9PEZI|nr:hypothetical protein K461DRAFT_289606 [Myriangium duriaei CBS 260.36]